MMRSKTFQTGPATRRSLVRPAAAGALLAGLLAVSADGPRAQRVTDLGPFAFSFGSHPVTAHRQVAWASAGTLYLYLPGRVPASRSWTMTGLGSIGDVAFASRDLVVFSITGNPTNNGTYVYEVGASPTVRRLSPVGQSYGGIYGDGDAVVAGVPGAGGQPDIGLYTGGNAFATIAADGLQDQWPHVSGRYVTWEKRAQVVFPYYVPYRHDRLTGITVPVHQNGASAVTDEAGRVAFSDYLPSGSSTNTYLHDGGATRVLTSATGGAYSYRTHHGQVAYQRVRIGLPTEIVLEEAGSAPRVLGSDWLPRGPWVRTGMTAWFETQNGPMQLREGTSAVLAASWPTSSSSGEFLDRGWTVYIGNVPGWWMPRVLLRESALTWERDTLSAAAGGTVDFGLQAGTANAGQVYLLVASLSGTHPGLPLGAVTLPLNPDPLFTATASGANSTIMVNTLGTLSNNGTASARFWVPPGLLNALVGQYLSFAYVVVTPTGFSLASNAARVKIAP